MNKRQLDVTFGKSYKNEPLPMIDGLPGDLANLNIERLRSLANALINIADDAERGCRFYKVYKY